MIYYSLLRNSYKQVSIHSMSDPEGKSLVLFSRESDVSQDVVVLIDLYSQKKRQDGQCFVLLLSRHFPPFFDHVL